MDEEKEVEPIVDGQPEAEMSGEQPAADSAPVENTPKVPGWKKQVSEYYKDRSLSDDDMDSAAEELIAELMDYKTRGIEANKKIIDVFMNEEKVAEFMSDLMKDVPLPVALARHFDPEDFTPSEEDPDYEQYRKASDERKSKREEAGKFEAELTANKVEASKVFGEFEAEKGMSQEEADAFIDHIDSILSFIHRGKITREFLDLMWKGSEYDNALATTRNSATIEGRNEAIDLEKKNYSKPKGDGLPDMASAGGMPEQPKKAPKPRFVSALDEIEERNKRRV